jgi:membrane protease YdiL (CAAX protease family)
VGRRSPARLSHPTVFLHNDCMRHTSIGQRLHGSTRDLVLVSVTGALALAADLALMWWNHWVGLEGRGVVALLALWAYLYLLQGDLPSLGLTLTPRQTWRYWARMTLVIGFAIGFCLLVGLGAWVLLGFEVPKVMVAPQDIGPTFLHMVVCAPVLEETLYRLVLCVPCVVLLRPWGAVALSGLVFAGLHLVYGNPGPENLVGGFFLAWAYLKSGTLVVPLLLHALGNLCALLAQVGAWYYLMGAL